MTDSLNDEKNVSVVYAMPTNVYHKLVKTVIDDTMP